MINIHKLLLVFSLLILIVPIFTQSRNTESPAPYVAEPQTMEKPSPSDWIKESQIKVYDKRIVIDLENAEWAKFTDANSMDPLIDQNSNAIEIIPKSYKELNVGDIISYEKEDVQGIIIHRIIQTGFDEEGWFAVTKGDNLKTQDPFKIRFNNIKRVVVGILY